MLFLQILLAVILVLAVVVLVAFLWLKKIFGSRAQGYMKALSYVLPYSARIKLEVAEYPEDFIEEDLLEAVQIRWKKMEKAGFSKLGQFLTMEDRYLVMGIHESGVVNVINVLQETCYEEYYAVGKSRNINLLTQNVFFSDLKFSNMKIRIFYEMDPQQAITRLQSSEPLIKKSVHQIILAYERIHAACMDKILRKKPTKTMLARWVEFKGLDPIDPDMIDDVMEMTLSAYTEALDESLRDHVRKHMKLSSDSWSRIEDELLVIKDSDKWDDIAGWFNNDRAERLMEQFDSQNMTALQIFTAVNKRLDESEQFVPLMTLHRPVHAEAFMKAVYLRSLDITVPEQQSGKGLKDFLYKSCSAEGETVRSSIVATDVADARAQLQRMGHRDVEIHSPNHEVNQTEIDLDLFADFLIESHSDSMPVVVGKIFLGNWLAWVPFLIWSVSAVYAGSPYDWLDYAGFSLLMLSLIWVVYIALPPVIYNYLLEARSWGRARHARSYVSALRKFGGARLLTAAVMDTEEAKILAEDGQIDAAMALLDKHKESLDTVSYLQHQSLIYEAAGDHPKMIKLQTELLKESPENLEFKVELALSLLRYTELDEQAEKLISGLHPQNCSEIFVAGLHYAQGLLGLKQGSLNAALKKFQQSMTVLQSFKNPLIDAMRAEISGYMAVCLRKLGDNDKADSIWGGVLPRLEALRARHLLSLYASS